MPDRILMLAPEPVLQPRGTPISVYHRLQALSELGFEVDLLTYPLGEPVEIAGVYVCRVWRPWGLERIKIGPSPTKLFLDALLFTRAVRMISRRRYAAIHSHEEASFMGVLLARLAGIPHLYDMHSSLPQQFQNWRKSYAPLAVGPFRHLERWAVQRSDVVIGVCESLVRRARALGPRGPVIMVENIDTLDADGPGQGKPGPGDRSEAPAFPANGSPTVIYTGNFEPYQGIDLLLESFARLHAELGDARLVLVGGQASDIRRCRSWVNTNRLDDSVWFAGEVPRSAVPAYLKGADLCASPRVGGDNVPLKLCSYLRTGKPLVATDLPVHRQVLNADVAVLVEPEPDAFARGMLKVLREPALAERLGRSGQAFAAERWQRATYRAGVAEAYRLLLGRAS